MRHPLWITFIALTAAVALSGCRDGTQTGQESGNGSSTSSLTVPAGTSLSVTLGTALSSENAGVGDSWTGSVRDGQDGIPAGSAVTGTVSAVRAARKGDRAMLDLELASVTTGGHRYAMSGGTEAVVAGSPRARNLGAIGAATAAGAIVGHAIGGSGKGTLVGAVVGGGGAAGVVSQTKGWQVVLKSGTALTFTTARPVAVRL